MTGKDYISVKPSGAIHPGEILLEYLEASGWNRRDLARITGIAPKSINEICRGSAAITVRTSLALEKSLPRPAHFWLNLQRQHDDETAGIKY